MIRSREILSLSLEHALLANRVVAAVSVAPVEIDPGERHQALENAVQFLGEMLKGRDFPNAASISDDSYRASLAYGDAIRAFRAVPNAVFDENSDPGRFLQELMKTAEQLRDARPVEQKHTNDLVSFFRSVRELSLASGVGPLETVVL